MNTYFLKLRFVFEIIKQILIDELDPIQLMLKKNSQMQYFNLITMKKDF